jgi:FtsZ-binding cell division protein ZapB
MLDEIPDEYLSYSELKDRIREECARALPKKERVLLMAQKLEEDLTLKETICDHICTDLKDVTAETWIRRCLPDEYKQHRRKSVTRESTDELRHSAVNDDKNVPEQTVMTVDTEGYEEPFEPASEIVKTLQKKIEDVTQERDSLSNENKVIKDENKVIKDENKVIKDENKIIKEKTLPQMFHEIQERFYDEPGLIKGDKLQKVHEEAGKNLVFLLERYDFVIQETVEKGQPVPVGLYIIAKPDMVFVPVRFTVDFDKRKLNISLWEKKLAG